jgi:hypothetical protein
VPVWFLTVVLIEPLASGDIVFELRLPKRLIELRILRVLRVWGLHSSLSWGCIVVLYLKFKNKLSNELTGLYSKLV